MKASKFTEAQKAFILKQLEEGTPVAEICRRAGIREVDLHRFCSGQVLMLGGPLFEGHG